MKDFLYAFFHFSKKERWGIYLLCFIAILSWIVPSFMFQPQLKADDLEIEMVELDVQRKKIILNHFYQKDSSRKKYTPFSKQDYSEAKQAVMFEFNPNTNAVEDWVKLGLPVNMAKGIVKYIGKGGRFRKKDDLKKIYGMTEERYQQLLPYIKMEDTEHQPIKLSYSEKIRPIDLNEADSAALLSLPGIGEKLSSRIIRFRERLGGFVAISQLSEVYGMDSALVHQLMPKLTIQSSREIKKININEVGVDVLKKHPYAGYVNAKLIITYRNAHGKIPNAAVLLSISEIDQEKMSKLIPYLIF